MKFFITLFIIVFLFLSTSCFKAKDEMYLLKMAEDFYSSKNVTNLREFSNALFKEIESNTNRTKLKKSKALRRDRDFYADIKLSSGDYSTIKRNLKLYISKDQDCSVTLNDTIRYQRMSNFNLIEHMVLHNNAEKVEPKGVYSDDLTVNIFAFNKKLNIFNVYFDNPHNLDRFSIEYDYEALNLIKTNSDKSYSSDNTLFLGHKFNSFVWKIMNQNTLRHPENLTLEIYFDLGKDFELFDVDFSLNFTKHIETVQSTSKHHNDTHNQTIVKYRWDGLIQPQDLLVIEAKFPLYFEHCGEISLNYYFIILGATFIIFLIGMLHLILSTVCFQEY